MKKAITLTVLSAVIAGLCCLGFYYCHMAVINFILAILFCLSFVVFIYGCADIWNKAAKVSSKTNFTIGTILIAIALILTASMFFIETMASAIAIVILGCLGLVLLVSTEIK